MGLGLWCTKLVWGHLDHCVKVKVQRICYHDRPLYIAVHLVRQWLTNTCIHVHVWALHDWSLHEMHRKTRQGNTTERQRNTTQLAWNSHFSRKIGMFMYMSPLPYYFLFKTMYMYIHCTCTLYMYTFLWISKWYLCNIHVHVLYAQPKVSL